MQATSLVSPLGGVGEEFFLDILFHADECYRDFATIIGAFCPPHLSAIS